MVAGGLEVLERALEVVVALLHLSQALGCLGEVEQDAACDGSLVQGVEHGREFCTNLCALDRVSLTKVNTGEAGQCLGDSIDVMD